MLPSLENASVLTWHPIDWSGDLVLVTSLQRVYDTEHFRSVATSGGWVGKDQTDGLLWVNDEDATDGESDTLLINVGGVLVVNPSHAMSALRSQIRLLWLMLHYMS